MIQKNKSRAYITTKVNYIKSQMQINKILLDNGITDSRHSTIQNKSELLFLKELISEGRKVKVGVKIIIPFSDEKNRNQIYRALFHYLKSKFESLTFGFVEEYNEAFVKEFMPYLIVDNKGKTISDIILPKLNNALEETKQGEQLFLENKRNEDEEEDAEVIEEVTKNNNNAKRLNKNDE